MTNEPMTKKKKQQLKFYLVGLGGLIIIVVVIAAIFWILDAQPDISDDKIVIDQLVFDCDHLRKIDGLCYQGPASAEATAGRDEEPAVFGVMIDNHVWARPPAGLSQASLVYEAVAEAPITRFLALFSSDNDLEKIGPVRSARLYYLDWVKEFDVPYLHVGGSQQALDEIAKSYYHDVNEFSNGSYFWRDSGRDAPHNVFTSQKLVDKVIKKNDWKIENDFESWLFKPEATLEDRAINNQQSTIIIDFATESFYIEWGYNKEDNEYLRYQAGRAHTDADGSLIKAKNVAVIYTESEVIDSYGRRSTRTVGSGDALIFQDGQAIEGVWRRPRLDSRTRFYDEDGQEVRFNPGPTWIEVVPTHFPEVVY